MKKVLIILVSLVLLFGLSIFTYLKFNESKIEINDNLKIEINTEHTIKEFIKNVKNSIIENEEETVIFDSLGEKELKITYKENYNKFINKIYFWKNKESKELIFKLEVIDTEKPIITAKDKITINEGNKVNLLKNVKVEDNSKEEIKAEVVGEYDIKKAGTYKLKYKATDSSNNTCEKDFELVVKSVKKKNDDNASKSTKTDTKNKTVSNIKYYIKVNKTQNVVMVYGKDSEGNYTNLVKTFVASAGNNTPTGIFKTDLKAETLSLVGGVYGHYTVRFLKSRGMWFHSVPYFTKPSIDSEGKKHWDNLEYEEYNKLGTLASLGCIRLAVRDAKWIYDNIQNGTTVEIYESSELPSGVVKPSAIKIDVNSENRGWDPTDPDPKNPWKN